MKMSYLETNPKTNHSYAICSADPSFIDDAAKEIRRWKKDGAIIELLPSKEALERWCNCLPSPEQCAGDKK